MGWITDNPERAGRITAVAAQSVTLLDFVSHYDKELAKQSKFVKDLYDNILKRKGYSTGEDLLKDAANLLPPDEKAKFLAEVDKQKTNSKYIEITCVFVSAFGVNWAWKRLKLPEQMAWGELWGIVKVVGVEAKDSILYQIRNKEAWKQPTPPQGEKMFVIEEAPFAVEEPEMTLLQRIRARIRVGAGSRFFATMKCTIVAIGVGVALDALVEWAMSGGYKSLEVEVCMSRLSLQYTLQVFQSMSTLISHMQTIDVLHETATKISNPIAKKALEDEIASQQIKLGQDADEALAGATWQKAWDHLHDQDVAVKAYLKDDAPKDTLISDTMAAVEKEKQTPQTQIGK